MQTVQVVLDEKLLRAADRAATRERLNRSELFRLALREHLKRLETRALEEADRAGYAKHPARESEVLEWEAETAWPTD